MHLIKKPFMSHPMLKVIVLDCGLHCIHWWADNTRMSLSCRDNHCDVMWFIFLYVASSEIIFVKEPFKHCGWLHNVIASKYVTASPLASARTFHQTFLRHSERNSTIMIKHVHPLIYILMALWIGAGGGAWGPTQGCGRKRQSEFSTCQSSRPWENSLEFATFICLLQLRAPTVWLSP